MKYSHHSPLPASAAVVVVVLLAGVATLLGNVMGEEENPINISDEVAMDETSFVGQFPGSSTVTIDYNLDGSKLGNSADITDFYVFQSLGTYDDCDVALPGSTSLSNEFEEDGPPISLNGVTEPTISTSGTSTSSVLVNTAAWTKGAETRFCLRMKLMLQASAGEDYEWYQRKFYFVATFSSDGSVNYDYTSVSNHEELRVSVDASINSAYLGNFAPSFAATADGVFSYGDTIIVEILFLHPMDAFSYSVDEGGAILLDSTENPLKDESGNTINLLSSRYIYGETDHARGLNGTLYIKIPKIVYQTSSTAKVRIPMSYEYTGGVRRQLLRALQDEDSTNNVIDSSQYAGPTSGTVNKIVTIQLVSLPGGDVVDNGDDSNSGAAGIGLMTAIVFFLGATVLFIT